MAPLHFFLLSPGCKKIATKSQKLFSARMCTEQARKVQNEFSFGNVDDLKNGNLCLSYQLVVTTIKTEEIKL